MKFHLSPDKIIILLLKRECIKMIQIVVADDSVVIADGLKKVIKKQIYLKKLMLNLSITVKH